MSQGSPGGENGRTVQDETAAGERKNCSSAVGGNLEQIEGEVKWFDPRKGYGFIVGPEGQDIFAHYSVIEGDGFRVLRDGARVRYSAECAGTRWKATRVERLSDEEADEAEVSVVRNRAFSRSPRR
ncbi:MAG: hypothetical protein CMJ31_13645 [Phycisphaerae bacterium]|nr:hypothetical protein [Phycisphaerae bacterium]